MKYQFNQAVHFGGKDYPRGINEVSEKMESNPHFLKYVSAGFIVDIDRSVIVTTKTTVERSQELFDRLVAKRDGKKIELSSIEVPAEKDVDAEPVQKAAGVDKKKKR